MTATVLRLLAVLAIPGAVGVYCASTWLWQRRHSAPTLRPMPATERPVSRSDVSDLETWYYLPSPARPEQGKGADA
jgi:hypothetical protein